jgi:hypothetical protein
MPWHIRKVEVGIAVGVHCIDVPCMKRTHAFLDMLGDDGFDELRPIA